MQYDHHLARSPELYTDVDPGGPAPFRAAQAIGHPVYEVINETEHKIECARSLGPERKAAVAGSMTACDRRSSIWAAHRFIAPLKTHHAPC